MTDEKIFAWQTAGIWQGIPVESERYRMGKKLVVLVITGFFCGALASEYFGTKLIFFVGGVILGDMLFAGAACLFSRIGGRIWHRNIESFLYGIAGFLIFVCCCVYGSVGNEHMVSTFFAALIYFLLLLSGRFIWAWLVKRRHTLFSWNPLCSGLHRLVLHFWHFCLDRDFRTDIFRIISKKYLCDTGR